MTDIGALELLFLALVSLLVFDRQSLPEAIRTAYRTFLRLSRQIGSVRDDLKQEMHVEEVTTAFKDSARELERLDRSMRSDNLALLDDILEKRA